MKTTVVSFSSRANGNCAQVAELIRSVYPDARLFDFSVFQIHACGNCVYECFQERKKCPFFEDEEYELLDTITKSDLVYFVLPNYCDYPCANYFIFNERSQCYFQNREDLLDKYLKVQKRSIVISNTNEENFRQALRYQSLEEPDILFLSARKYGKSSIDTDLLTNREAVEDIRDFL